MKKVFKGAIGVILILCLGWLGLLLHSATVPAVHYEKIPPSLSSKDEHFAEIPTSTPNPGSSGAIPNAPKNCAGYSIQSASISAADGGSVDWAKLRNTPSAYNETITQSNQTIVIQAVGPILGSMDGSDIKVITFCGVGPALLATITRSSDFNGSVLQNINWRPIIQIEITPQQAQSNFQAIWLMRLDNGGTPVFTATPPYEPLRYPIVVNTRIP